MKKSKPSHNPILNLRGAVRTIAVALNEGLIPFSAPDYAEPGYTLKHPKRRGILFANWNDKTDYQNGKFVVLDDTMSRLAALAERAGYEIEWDDEWAVCGNCGKAFRTNPDSYSWSMYGKQDLENGPQCGDCIKKDPTDYLADLEDNPRAYVSFDIDLDKYGYQRYGDADADPWKDKGRFEHGLYGGQAADPRVITRTLRTAGVSHYLYNLESQGQFDIQFSVWIRKEDFAKAEAALNGGETKGADPAEMFKQATQSIPTDYPPLGDVSDGGIVVTRFNEDGTSKRRLVSKEIFAAGKALDWPEENES